MHNFTPRVSRAFDAIRVYLMLWCNQAFRFLVVQHEADERVKRTHCHVMLYGVPVKEERLKRIFRKDNNEEFNGNKDWSWVHKKYPEGLPEASNGFWETGIPSNAKDQQVFDYIKYCLKGKIENLKYVKNINDAVIKACIDAWKPDDKEPSDTIVFIDRRPVVKKAPYQQEVIALAAADWKQYRDGCRDDGTIPDTKRLKEFVCDAMRSVSKGINPYMIKEIAYAILYDDLDYRSFVLNKIQL